MTGPVISRRPLPEPEDDEDARLLDALRRYGWIGRGVDPSQDDPPGTPRFAYTAGLERTWRHPELIVVGIPWPAAGAVLRGAVERVRAGQAFQPGQRYADVVAAGDVVVVEVSHAHRIFSMTYAMWLYGGEDFRALQLVWPDAAGRYPWDEGYDRASFGEQEDLSEDVHELRAAAERGDLTAAKRLGDIWVRYRQLQSAERWYRAVADAGRTDGLIGLGLTHEFAGDDSAALEAFGRAAEQGDPAAARLIERLVESRSGDG